MKNEIEKINPLSLIEKAVAGGADMATLEGLFNLQERWEKRQALKAYKVAFVSFQRNKPVLKKTRRADFGEGKAKFDYLPLPTLQKLIDPVLSSAGFSYRWETDQINTGIKITCIISHENGHEEKTSLIGPSDISGKKQAIQAIGSTVSYLKRYTLEAALGLSSDDDNDGAKEVIKKDDKNYKGAIQALQEEKVTLREIELRFEFSKAIKKDFLRAQIKSNKINIELP